MAFWKKLALAAVAAWISGATAGFVLGLPGSRGADGAQSPTQPNVDSVPEPAARVLRNAPCEQRLATAERRVERLTDRVEVLRRRIAEFDEEINGVPLPWTDDVPDKYGAEYLTSILEEAIRSCGLRASIEDVDCAEPPCIALLLAHRHESVQNLKDCPVWQEHYGTEASVYYAGRKCEDPKRRNIRHVAPWPVDLWDSMDPDAGTNWKKRFHARNEILKKKWECESTRR